MVHVRREFIPLARGKTAPIATEALRRIGALYVIEAEVRGEAPEVRRTARQGKSRPLVLDLFAWLSVQLVRRPGSSPTADAIRYALNHQGGLVRFLEDGRIELDTDVFDKPFRAAALSSTSPFARGLTAVVPARR